MNNRAPYKLINRVVGCVNYDICLRFQHCTLVHCVIVFLNGVKMEIIGNFQMFAVNILEFSLYKERKSKNSIKSPLELRSLYAQR